MFHKRLLNEFKMTRKYTAVTVACQWVSMMANLLFVYAGSVLIRDMLFGAVTGQGAVTYLVLMAIFLAVRFAACAGKNHCSVKTADLVKARLRGLIFDKLLRLGKNYHQKVSTSEVVQISTEGADQLEFYMSQYVPQFFYSMIAPVTLFLVALQISVKVAVVLLLCVPLIPVSIILVQKIAKRLLGKYWGSYTKLGDSFLENLQGLTTLKIYGADEAYAKRMDEDAESFRRITMRVLIMQLNSISIMDLVAYGGAAAGILLTILEYMKGNVSFTQCVFMLLISAEFFLPLRMLGSFFHIAMNGNAAADKIFRLLDMEEQPKGESLEFPEGDISFKKVGFSYEDGERQILEQVELRFKAGSMTALVGESGCGKSTIASLLMGERDGYQGEICIGDETELRQIAEDVRLKNMTRINHSGYIFKGTVEENLRMGNEAASAANMLKVLRQVDLYRDFEKRGGLSMKLSERGENLSGGQRQRLALARALLHDSQVYVFDEATSNVDVESENKIMEVVEALSREKTVILISHRLANVVCAGKIYVMDQGSICESGTHSELMRKEGRYCEMFRLQQELEQYSAGEERSEAVGK
ncbi:ABC transporter ATP-binding protein/permease [bacterium 210820-DFI.6.37]|nr:ABC transporter ATP-binding protein/permease [bacterium 210820-DFI.6.37]